VKGICSVCGKQVRCHVPKHGDGSAIFPVRHDAEGQDDLQPGFPQGCSGVALPAVELRA
jgi:hypothetical protein